MKIIDIQGHRGCRGLMPENTISAFIKAIDLGVNTLEMDVVITKDRQVLVSHEAYFNHEITTKFDGELVTEDEELGLNIYKMDYTDVQQYDVGLRRHNRFPDQQKIAAVKPLLSDVIHTVEAYTKKNKLPSVRYNIEIKTELNGDGIYQPNPIDFVALVMCVLLKLNVSERVNLQSFDVRPLQCLHKKYPTIRLALLVEEYDKKPFGQQIKDLGFTPNIYSPAFELVDEQLMVDCKKAGVKVIPWTLNDMVSINRMIAMGVDGIITDYPNLFQ